MGFVFSGTIGYELEGLPHTVFGHLLFSFMQLFELAL